MIVDTHTQVWANLDQLGRQVAKCIRDRSPEAWAEFDSGPAGHEKAMSYVDMAFVFGFRSERLGAHVPNEFVAEFVSQSPERRVGVAGIDPLSPDAAEQFTAAIEMGFIGVNISPAMQGFHPAHSDAMGLYERAVTHGTPIFVTLGDPMPASAMLEFARPMLWDEVARTFPDLPIVINQVGHPWIDETLLMLSKHPKMYADISGVASRPWQLFNALLTAQSMRVIDKLLFGSGYPRETPAKTIEALYSINSFTSGTQLPAIPRSQIRSIVERPVAKCLGLDIEPTEKVNKPVVSGTPRKPDKPTVTRPDSIV
jgi:uncharacterized protein